MARDEAAVPKTAKVLPIGREARGGESQHRNNALYRKQSKALQATVSHQD